LTVVIDNNYVANFLGANTMATPNRNNELQKNRNYLFSFIYGSQ